MVKKSRARALTKSVRYPTYQLSATAASKKETLENQLVICALTVLEWLRTKFQKFDIPEAFQTPPPEDYSSVPLAELKNAHIDAGYTVETLCIPEDKIWAFRLIEPDLSTKWENGKEISTALPGRIFETNIAFRIVGPTLHCGVSVIVSEPENTEASKRAIVLCPAVVPKLADNPKIGLKSGYLIEEKVLELNSKERIKQLKNYLDTGILPAVIFCDCIASPVKKKNPPDAPKPRFPMNKPAIDLSSLLTQPIKPNALVAQVAPAQDQPAPPVGVPYDIQLFKQARLAYVHCFHLPADQFAVFNKMYRTEANSGDVLFLETKPMGSEASCFPYSEGEESAVFSDIMTKSRDYLRQKPISFGQVAFLTDAKRLMMEHYGKVHLSAQEMAEMYENKIELMQQAHKDTLMDKDDQIADLSGKIARLKEQLNESYAQMQQLRDDTDERVRQAQQDVDAANSRMEYYKSLLNRPKTPQEVPDWVKARFADRLEFHERAVKLIQAIPVQEIDMSLLCDAIEYLAMEYRDLRCGKLTWSEANQRCTQKYDRPFTITGSGDTSIEMYAGQYKIKYKHRLNFKGKSSEVALREHLKIGNTPPNMVRIYFFYDDIRNMIIVGSLPKHLPVAQIKA